MFALQLLDIAAEDELHFLRLFFCSFFHHVFAVPTALARLDFVREFFENYLTKSLARMELDNLRASVVADWQRQRPFVAAVDYAGEIYREALSIDR